MLHQKITFPGISKDLNDDLSEIQIVLKKMKKRSFLSLPTATAKKFRLTFHLYRLPKYVFLHCKPTHYLRNLHLDLFRYRQIQIQSTFKIQSNYWKISKESKYDVNIIIHRYFYRYLQKKRPAVSTPFSNMNIRISLLHLETSKVFFLLCWTMKTDDDLYNKANFFSSLILLCIVHGQIHYLKFE